jgi:hypothetical protein
VELRQLKWLFPQEKATLHTLRYGPKTLTFLQNRPSRKGGSCVMIQSMFVILSEGLHAFQRSAPWVSIELLCVFACGITIEGTTQTPMWYYIPTLAEGCGEKRLLKSERAKLRFAIPFISFEATTVLFHIGYQMEKIGNRTASFT